jgi:hypothetical protein
MKTAFTTRKRALSAARRIEINTGRPLLVYKCRCRAWHLTRKGALDAAIAKLLHSQS